MTEVADICRPRGTAATDAMTLLEVPVYVLRAKADEESDG